MKTGFVGQTPDLTKTDTPGRIHSVAAHCIIRIDCICSSIGVRSYLILLDDAVLLVRGRRVPWYTDGGAVLTPYCQHCHLLWWCSRCWLGEGKKHLDIIWGCRAIFYKKNVFVIMECLPQIHSLYSCSKQENKGRSTPSAADGCCSTPSQYHIFMVVCTTGKVLRPKTKQNKKKIQPTPTFLYYRLICLAFSATHFMQNRFNLCFSNCTNNTHPPERIREGVGFLLPRKYRWVQ